MGIDFAAPWALLGMLGLGLVYRWHRRDRSGDGPVFSAWFLVPGDDADHGRARRLRAPLLFAARCLAWTALVLTVAGPRFALDAGTVVLATAPVTPDADWARPITIVRAGRPPTVETGDFAPVVGRPAWDRALELAHETAPSARVAVADGVDAHPIVAGAAALDGEVVAVTATLAESTTAPPRIVVGDVEIPLEQRARDWFYRGALPAGPAEIVSGSSRWPICVPDATPLTVAADGWPEAVDAVLDALPHVRRVPAESAAWRPGPAPERRAGWAAFAPDTTWLEFADRPTRDAAPLWFAGRLPPPGATVDRWRPLDAPARPILFAGDAVVADHGTGPAGTSRRFGFDPAASDLPATAGWPVLFDDAIQTDRSARGRCITHPADGPLIVAVDAPIDVEIDGRRTRHTPRDGQVWLDALDTLGHATLRGPDGQMAHVAVIPGDERAPAPAIVSPPRRTPPAYRAPLVVGLLGLVLVLILVDRGRPRVVLAGLIVASGLVGVAVPGDEAARQATVIVDTTGSMPIAETRNAAGALMTALGERAGDRLNGAGGAWTADSEFGGRDLTAAFVRADRGPIVLVTDGRDPALPRVTSGPVLVVPVSSTRPDARVVDAHAVRLGDRIFARATVIADRRGPAQVTLGAAMVGVTLAPDRPQSVQAVLPASSADTIEARVEMPGDRQPANDVRPTPVEGQRPPEAVVIGARARPWAVAGGLEPLVVPAGTIGESGARLAQARAMLLHDQPADRFDDRLVLRLRRWVEAGGVLFLAGRQSAFGPGGWTGGPLDALSPLTSDPRPPGTGRVGVALVLDRSGSMSDEAGGPGVDALGALAGAVAGGLRPADRLAVIAFGGEVATLLPPTPIDTMRDGRLPVPAIARGGTVLAPAIRRSIALLASQPVEVRIAVVVGDGRMSDADEVTALTDELRDAGIRVMGVLVGDDPDDGVISALATATEGQVVRADGARLGLAVSSGLLTVGRGGVAAGGPVSAGSGWSGRVGGVPPPVTARVRVGARSGARILARVDGEPMLAEWSIGRGRVLALATDAWALDAEQWSTLLAPATAPRPGDVQLAVERDRVVYLGTPAEPPPGGVARIRGPEGVAEIAWRPDGPGRATAPLPAGAPAVLEVSAATARGAVVEAVVRPPPIELRRTGVDRDVIALQAAISGGAVVDDPAGIAAAFDALSLPRPHPWAPLAALLALVAVVFDAWRWSGGRWPTRS